MTRRDGMLDVWDYMDQQNDPVLSHQVHHSARTNQRRHQRSTSVCHGTSCCCIAGVQPSLRHAVTAQRLKAALMCAALDSS